MTEWGRVLPFPFSYEEKMKVKFKNAWFAPQAEYRKDAKRTFSGQSFKPGEQIVPDSLYPFLPKSARVIEPPKSIAAAKEIPVPPEPSLKDFDNDRAALMDEAVVQNAQHDGMAKARAARKAKADKRKAS